MNRRMAIYPSFKYMGPEKLDIAAKGMIQLPGEVAPG